MNLNDLEKWLGDNNVPEYLYVINDLGGGEVNGIGLLNNYWCTYYSERGKYSDIEKYENEDHACRAFSEKIRRILKIQYSVQLPPPV